MKRTKPSSQIYGQLSKRKHIAWIARLRTGHCSLNSYLERFNTIDDADAGISQPLHVMATDHVAADCHVPVLAGLPVTVGASSYWQSCDLDKYI